MKSTDSVLVRLATVDDAAVIAELADELLELAMHVANELDVQIARLENHLLREFTTE